MLRKLVKKKSKGGMFELVIVIVFILCSAFVWAILGNGLYTFGNHLKAMNFNSTFNLTSMPNSYNAIDWPLTAFYVFCLLSCILVIIWAIKKNTVERYE